MVEPLDVAAALNRDCHCIAVDRDALEARLADELDDHELAAALRRTHRDLFAPFPVFLSRAHRSAMERVVEAVDEVVATAGFRRRVAARCGYGAPARPTAPLLGFDFHLPATAEAGRPPQLIEINTNPGGVLLALFAARAQRACCPEVEAMREGGPGEDEVERALVSMVREAGEAQETLGVAIVDEDPPSQFLYPEMRLYRRLFARHGMRASIAAPEQLRLHRGRLVLAENPIDVVYNRLTDFALERPASAALRAAWRSGALGVTPDPWAHALYADKRDLELFGAAATLRGWGVSEGGVETLSGAIPESRTVDRAHADALWEQRRGLFFKPAAGYGSRGAYDGAKLTRKTFERILDSSYVVQRRVPPSERILVIDGERRALKVDLRCVVWKGRVLMVLARLYRGQTTNLRTEGGGLATVFVVPEAA